MDIGNEGHEGRGGDWKRNSEFGSRNSEGKSKIKNQIAKLQSKIQSGFSHGLRRFHGFKFRPQKGSKKHKTFLTMINADFMDLNLSLKKVQKKQDFFDND